MERKLSSLSIGDKFSMWGHEQVVTHLATPTNLMRVESEVEGTLIHEDALGTLVVVTGHVN